MKTRSLTAIGVFITLLVTGAHELAAATLYVSQTSPNPTPPYATWETAAHTIQEAVNAARDGDTVLAAEGEYRLSAQITVSSAITLRSVTGAGQTMLNGQDGTRCFWVSNALAVVDGFTMFRGGG